MGAWITISMSVDLTSRPGSARELAELVESTAGTVDVVANATTNTLSFRMQYPGNLTAIMKRMAAIGLTLPATADIILPVRSLAIPELRTDAAHVAAILNGGPTTIPRMDTGPLVNGEGIMDARFVDGNLHATIVPTSMTLQTIWDVLCENGLTAQDTPTLVNLRHLVS